MTDNTKKPTKKANFSAIKSILKAAEQAGITLNLDGITFDSLATFIDHEVELLDNKTAAAQKRAAAKRAEGDALRERIYEVLNDSEFMTINEIIKALNDDEVSPQMVTARLGQLADPDIARVEKEMKSVSPGGEGGKTKKLSAYRRLA